DVQRVVASHARKGEYGFACSELGDDTLQRGGVCTAVRRRLLYAALACERVRDRELAARLARDPFVGVQTGERATWADVDEPRRAIELRACVGEVELLRDAGAPVVEEVGAERNDELCVLEAQRRPRNAIAAAIRLERGAVSLEVDTEVLRHAVRREPRVEEAR